MGAASRQGPAVRATLCEIERGLFYTTFIGCGPASDLNDIPQYQVVANAAEARRHIEELCVALGYAEVIWAGTMVVPPAHRNDVAGLPFTAGPSETHAGKPAGR